MARHFNFIKIPLGNDQRPGGNLIKNLGFLIKGAKIKSFLKNKWFLRGLVLLAVIILIGLLGVILPGLAVIKQTKVLEAKARETKDSLQKKDLNLIKSNLDEINQEVEKLEKNYQRLVIVKITPGLRNYYLDGERLIKSAKAGVKAGEIVIEAVEPYQDFLGLKSATESGQLSGGGEKTTEERIDFLVESIEGIKPRLDEIETEVKVIKDNIAQIDPNRYPVKLKGKAVRSKITKTKESINQITQFINQGRPLIEKADWLLGKDQPRNYLFLFQNDAELRPTGGFWTAYGIMKVDNGEIIPGVSQDMYALDALFNSNIPAPRPIKAYHKKVYYLHLRDINLSPDFKTSVEEFAQYYKKIKGEESFDAVIAIDTQVLVDILKVLGRVGVPGWGNFEPNPDDRCWGCPQVVYQLEMLADKPTYAIKTNRKSFLSPLMHSVIANALGSPKEKVGELANAVLADLKQKHILVYFPDDDLQKAVEGLGIAGRIKPAEEDYFHLNDANFAGAKSNLFIDQEVKQEIKVENGKIIKKVTVSYKNTAPASNCNLEKGDLCLNGLYRDWFRFYLPKGSKLIKMVGSEVKPVVYEELGKTVLEGFYGNQYPLYPQGSTRVTVEYELPFKPGKTMKMLIQKQPGTKEPKYQIWVNGHLVEEFNLLTDKTLNLDL